jgi:zinc protease
MKRACLTLLLAAAPLLAQTAAQTPPPQPPTTGPLSYPNPSPAPTDPNKKPATPAIIGIRNPAPPASARPAAGSTTPSSGPAFKDLKFPPLRPVQMPKVDSVTLPNGLRVYLLEDRELPMVNGTALVHTGMLLDPPGKVGLANLTATVMRSGGAGTATPTQLNERLEDLGATVETGMASNSATVMFSSLKESTADVLAIFKQVLTAPQFNEESIEQARTTMRNAIAHRNDDAARLGAREFSDILYGRDTPFGREPQYATLGDIVRADLQAFHARYFFPKNTVLAIRGDFDTAAMKAQIQKLFADWTVEQAPPEFPKARPWNPADAGVYVATKKDVSQTYIAVGQLGVLLNDKDYAAFAIMAGILGGGSNNRLTQHLRTRASRTSISAVIEPGYDLPGLFEISGSISSLGAIESLKAIQEEVARIRSSEVTDDELRTAKETAINSLVFAFDTKAKTLNRLLTYEYYGYPADFIDQYQKALEAVTRADVLRVAKERLKPETFITVLVGDPHDFIPPIESLNQPVHPIDLTVAVPKIVAAKSSSASLEKGQALMALLQQAVGGLDKLAALKDSTLVANYIVDQGGKVTPIKHTERWLAPTQYREDNELGGGTISSYFDGQFGWITVPGGSIPLTGLTLQQIQGNLFRQYQLLLQGGTLPGTSVNAVDDQTVEISGPSGQWARIVLDAATGLPLKIRYDAVSKAMPPPVTEEVWSDFRDVAGIKMPFKITISEGGRKYADVTIADFRANTGLKLKDLDKRP